MSDERDRVFTPSTVIVRDAYRGTILVTDRPNVFEVIDEEQADAEFDRWLAEVKRNAWARGYNEGYSTAEKRNESKQQTP